VSYKIINRIKTRNILNGIIFSIVELVINAGIITPFAIYYVLPARALYATVAIGIMLNCLTIVAFGVQQYIRKEKDVGIQHMFNKDVREKISHEYPHLSNDISILVIAMLLPFVMLFGYYMNYAFSHCEKDRISIYCRQTHQTLQPNPIRIVYLETHIWIL
jgi:hypothetical protein